MSLIQEALRRRQEEEGKAPVPVSETVVPPAAPPRRRLHAGSVVGFVRLLCYFVLAVGACAGIYALYRSFTLEQKPSSEVASVPEPRVPPDPVASPPQAQAPEAVTPAPPANTVEPVPSRVVPPPVQPPAITPPSSSPPQPPREGEWPELKIMGVVARPRQEDSSAVINGQIEEVGATLRGVKLLEVTASGVLLEYAGERKIVRVGRTTTE